MFHDRASRRDFLTVGALTGMGLALPDVLQAQENAAGEHGEGRGTFGRARSVIMLYLHGGHPQLETWDPKPNAPAETRGEFGDRPTKVPGIRISELLPLSAGIMDRLTIVRSMTHKNPNHVQASLPAMTGHCHPPGTESKGDFPPAQTDFPPFGAVLDNVRPATENLPTWVQVGPRMCRTNGTPLHGQSPGFLGGKHRPFVVDQDLLPEDVTIKSLSCNPDVPVLRLRERRDLLAQIDSQRWFLGQSAEAQRLDHFAKKAFHLLTSDVTRQAFDLASEPKKLRDRYGQTQFGQCCLLARRLATASIPMINVHYCETPKGSWDTHSENFKKMKNSLAPTFDRAFSALLTDLDDRGLLDETLVIATAEFGRTPKINGSAGRDHWPWVYSIAMAGAGVKRGMVYGSSDSIAAYPESRPCSPADFAATVYHLLGVPDDTTIYDIFGQPHRLVIGNKIDGILV